MCKLLFLGVVTVLQQPQAYFVLKGDSTFSEQVVGTDYLRFYRERCLRLESFETACPNKYRKLLKYYDREIFRTKTDEEATERNDCQKRFDEELQAAQDDPNSEEE